MTRHAARAALAAITVLLLGAGLSGCVPDRPGDAASWLAGQQGVVSSSVLANHDGEFQSSGISRGELAPDLSDAGLENLVKAVEGYLDKHDQVSIRLGRKGIDFTVSTDDATTTTAIALWKQVAKVPDVQNAIIRGDNSVHARVLRPAAVKVLAGLEGFGADVSLEAFPDVATLADDTKRDDFFDEGIYSADSLGIHLAVGCSPPQAERKLAESFFARDEVVGGALELCTSFDLDFAEGASYSTVIPALYDEVAAADLVGFPVTAHQVVGPYADGHLVTVTPGDPAAFGILSAFEAAPAVYYVLGADRSLAVTEYGTATADLLALVAASPTAASLPLISIEGSNSKISGTLDQLAVTLQQADAFIAASDIFTQVELSPTTGSVDLQSPVGQDPDVVAAAKALRDSGAWQGRVFTVTYAAASLTITDGVAATNDPNYTDPHVIDAFIDAWNATVSQ